MATIIPVINGESGLSARTKINTALASVDSDATLTGDGTAGTPLAVNTAQFLVKPGLAGGQSAIGGTAASEELSIRGTTAGDLGLVRAQSPIVFDDVTAANALSAYSVQDDSTQSFSAAFIGGTFNASPSISFSNPVFIWEALRGAPDIQSNVAPSFAAFTLFQALAMLRAGSGGTFDPLNSVVLNAGVTSINDFSGTRSCTTTVINAVPQIRTTVSGAVLNWSTCTGVNFQPTFSTEAGSTVGMGTVRGLWARTPQVGFLQPQLGVEGMTAYVAVDVDDISFGGDVTKRALRSAIPAASNARFLENTGGARSDFLNSSITFNDLFGLTFGNSDDLSVGWAASDFLFFQFNSTTDQLQISNPSADRFLFSSAVQSEFNFNCDRFSLGAQTGAVGNQVGTFVAPTRTATVAGEWSDFLLTQAGNITVDNVSMSVLAGWTINAPSISLSGSGSVTTGCGLNIGGNVNQGDNRIGLRIISNPTGGSGINAALWITAGSSRFDGRVDINNGIALGGGASATLGTIGGSGPTSAAQAQWVEIDVNGTPHWIPAWT